MITFEQVKANPQIQQFIKQSAGYLKDIGYTDHGFRHVGIVADRAGKIARNLKFSKVDTENSKIAGYCHDMGNFLGRTYHHYWAGLLFHQVFGNNKDVKQVSDIMEAIVAHDKEDINIMSKVSAAAIIADKSDVHRSRVLTKKMDKIKADIHDRVNYAVKDNQLKINNGKKTITLDLTIDTKFTQPMNYFEIFTARMVYCRHSAEYLGYKFSLEINKFKLA